MFKLNNTDAISMNSFDKNSVDPILYLCMSSLESRNYWVSETQSVEYVVNLIRRNEY